MRNDYAHNTSTKAAMTFRCIKPMCDPLDCSDCNCAVAEDVYFAIRDAVLELAAKECDKLEDAALLLYNLGRSPDRDDGNPYTKGKADGALESAAAVRAMKGRE